ncbi:MAG: phosphotransferase family protein [Candidatus Odinarchaeota archaeon]
MPDSEKKLTSGLLPYLKKSFPERENIQVSDVTNITDGWETEIYSFILDYHEGSRIVQDPLILRVYPGNDARDKSLREYQVMKAVFAAGYPVPEVHFVEEEASHIGRPFMIMQRIFGRPLWDLLASSSRKKRQELLSLFCQLFVDLHELDWNRIASKTDVLEWKRAYSLNEALPMFKASLRHFKKTEFDPVVEWLVKRQKDITSEQFSLIHQDFHPNNILVTDDGKPYVIDWGNWRIMDYRVDLGWTLLLVGTYESLETRNSILGRYEDIRGSEVENIEYFDVVAALRRLVDISISLSSGATERGMREGAEEMMKGSVRHIKNVYELLIERTGITISQVEELIQQISR